MDFANATDLDSARLERLVLAHTAPYRHDKLRVRIRYSRGADFSGTCYYADHHIYVNLGRHVRYPYRVGTHIARSQSNQTHWWRETYFLLVRDAYQLVLFVYRHELYHYLVKAAGRNPRRKEAMCDRFATRGLVDEMGVAVVDCDGRPVPRASWDFQELEQFVAAAPKVPRVVSPEPSAPATGSPRPIPVRVRGVQTGSRRPRRGP
jgi:hypothetical protein